MGRDIDVWLCRRFSVVVGYLSAKEKRRGDERREDVGTLMVCCSYAAAVVLPARARNALVIDTAYCRLVHMRVECPPTYGTLFFPSSRCQHARRDFRADPLRAPSLSSFLPCFHQPTSTRGRTDYTRPLHSLLSHQGIRGFSTAVRSLTFAPFTGR